jgi:hypothetical protein
MITPGNMPNTGVNRPDDIKKFTEDYYKPTVECHKCGQPYGKHQGGCPINTEERDKWFAGLPRDNQGLKYCEKCNLTVFGSFSEPELEMIKDHHFQGLCVPSAVPTGGTVTWNEDYPDLKTNLGVQWNRERSQESDVELQLLFVVMGENCTVVKVEHKRDEDPQLVLGHFNYNLNHGEVDLIEKPFAEIRAAVDELANKEKPPVPRLYRDDIGDLRLQIWATPASDDLRIAGGDYDALSKLAGRPLPIYKPRQGIWAQLYPQEMTFGEAKIEIWRFTLT